MKHLVLTFCSLAYLSACSAGPCDELKKRCETLDGFAKEGCMVTVEAANKEACAASITALKSAVK